MVRVPERSIDELLLWIAYERDAAWATKLAILRAKTREDIALLGAHLREHERHADELAQVVRAAEPRRTIPDEPSFVTRDAHVIGALDGDEPVLAAMMELEAMRVARGERRAGRATNGHGSMVDALLERHLADARARLAALRRRRRAASIKHKAAA